MEKGGRKLKAYLKFLWGFKKKIGVGIFIYRKGKVNKNVKVNYRYSRVKEVFLVINF